MTTTNAGNNQVITPNLIEAVKCWVLAETYMTNEITDERWQEGYEAECRLFNEFFVMFSNEEHITYRDFIAWLNKTQMWKSDLTIVELFNVYKSK